MRIFFALSAALGVSFALSAQTNSPSSETAAAPLVSNVTKIQSESGEFLMKSNVYIYRGDVHIDNPQMKLTCELLTVEAPKLQEGKYNRATAETNVVIDWVDEKGPNHATSDKAVYTYILTNLAKAPEELWETNAFVVLTGNPVVTNVSGSFQGDPIKWDRIKDTITSPNMLKMTIKQGETNTSGLFETPAPKQPKTDHLQK